MLQSASGRTLILSQAVAPLFPAQAAGPPRLFSQAPPPLIQGVSQSPDRRALLAEIQAGGRLRRHGHAAEASAQDSDEPAISFADTVARLLERLTRAKGDLVNLRPSPALTRTALVAPADAEADAATVAASRRRLLLQEITARRRRVLGGEGQPADPSPESPTLAPAQPRRAHVEGAQPSE